MTPEEELKVIEANKDDLERMTNTIITIIKKEYICFNFPTFCPYCGEKTIEATKQALYSCSPCSNLMSIDKYISDKQD